MAHTAVVYARIDSALKQEAEELLNKMGISPSSAIQMLYSQILLTKAFPFQPGTPTRRPLGLGELSKEQIEEELRKGLESLRAGKFYTHDEVDQIFKEVMNDQ